MPRSPDVLDDPTPLDSPVVNVSTRVGWLLRTTRLHTVGAPPTASAFAQRVGVPQTAVSGWEKGTKDPDAAAVTVYEQALGLSPGLLLSTVAGLRREFGQPARQPGPPAGGTLEEVSARVRPGLEGTATGAQWLEFAVTLSTGALVLPDFQARPPVERLVSELVRSVGDAYLPRQEALALLRTGPYHQVALDACLDFGTHPDVQVAADVLAVVGSRPDRALLHTMCGLLDDPRPDVAAGACWAIATMLRSPPGLRPDWLREVAPAVLSAYAASVEDPEQHARLSGLLRHLPAAFVRLVRHEGLPEPLPAPSGADQASRAATWTLATEIAMAVMDRLDSRPEPLLARTTYEALVDGGSLRGVWARLVLMALPYRDVVADVVAGWPGDRSAAQGTSMSVLLSHLGPVGLADAERRLAEGGAGLDAALVTVAHAADKVDADRLRELLVSPGLEPLRRRVLYAAGMTGSPALRGWTEDTTLDPEVRAAARWWIEQGARVDDERPLTSSSTW